MLWCIQIDSGIDNRSPNLHGKHIYRRIISSTIIKHVSNIGIFAHFHSNQAFQWNFNYRLVVHNPLLRQTDQELSSIGHRPQTSTAWHPRISSEPWFLSSSLGNFAPLLRSHLSKTPNLSSAVPARGHGCQRHSGLQATERLRIAYLPSVS